MIDWMDVSIQDWTNELVDGRMNKCTNELVS